MKVWLRFVSRSRPCPNPDQRAECDWEAESFLGAIEAASLSKESRRALRSLYPFVVESQGADLGEGRMLVPLFRVGPALLELARQEKAGPEVATLVRLLEAHEDCAASVTLYRELH